MLYLSRLCTMMFLRCMRLVAPGLHQPILLTMVGYGASSWCGPIEMYQMIQSLLAISIIKATHIYLYLGYDALLDMISWRPCPSLPRDRFNVRLSPKIFLTLADHHNILLKHTPSLIHHVQSQPWFTEVY